MTFNGIMAERLNRARRIALLCAIVGVVLAVLGAIFNTRQFFISYAWSYFFWLGLALGCMALTMIHSLTSGRWGDVTRRFQEAGFMTLPVLALLFVPILFGLEYLYPWAQHAEVVAHPTLQKRAGYMAVGPFVIRAAAVFVVWILIAWLLRRWSLEQDTTVHPGPTRRMRALSGVGLILYVLAATIGFVDWVMSMEIRWFSTMFPIIICIGQILTALAFCILMLSLFRKVPPLSEVVTTFHLYQLGTLLFAFVLFWTYINFGQLLIVYSGNLPREIEWYLHRIAGNWKLVVGAIAMFHFFLPFYLMLFRPLKERYSSLTALAALVFGMRFVDMFWVVTPTFYPKGVHVHWLDFILPLALGGIWTSVFIVAFSRHPLMPANDPRIQLKPAAAHVH